MVAEVKQRKLRKTDWDRVEEHVTAIYDERKSSTFRKEHEGKWTEIDRQIAMVPLKRTSAAGKILKGSWHNTIELGELSKDSEIITSDVMRIAFPTDKSWFQAHVHLQWPTDPKTGKPAVISEKQKVADGLLRSMMGQQHQDFGLKARIRLSIKEALHHGSFVAEVGFDKKMMAKDGGKIRMVGAPVWRPYSMWNAYPDPSPSITGADMFYDGSMLLVDYMPLWKLKGMAAKGDGWMSERLSKVEKEEHKTPSGETKDVELIKLYGDISIDRNDGDMLLPNSKVMMANGVIVYWAPNDLPYPNIIYSGYERQDVRDPYYTSPIIKQSPIQKAASVTLNKFLDASALKVEPPLEYDGNDPDYVANDGPEIAPGAKTATKSMGKGMQVLDIGEPSWALKALELFMRQLQEGTGVSALRSGTTNSDRQTAFEVNKVAQGAEVRTIEFVSQLEASFRAFLYMQHEFNRMYMDEYEFYNEELHTPDVMRARKKDIQANAHFEVVGTRGLLGEEQRTQRVSQTTAFLSANPMFAPLLRAEQIAMEMYRDAGKKNPEDFVKADDGKPSPQDKMMQQKMQEMQQMLQKFSQENHDLKQKHDEAMAKIMTDKQISSAELAVEKETFTRQLAEQRREFDKEFALKAAEVKADIMTTLRESSEVGGTVKHLKSLADSQSAMLEQTSKALVDVAGKVEGIAAEQKTKKKKKVTAPSGKTYTVEDQ